MASASARLTPLTGIISTVAGKRIVRLQRGRRPGHQRIPRRSGRCVAVDGAGNLFIADAGNARIRKVAAGTGIISTVAGNGSGGFSGDGGPATSASLPDPAGVAVDASGNLFISELGNRRIRKVDAGTGIISTVAGNGLFGFSGDGGPATSASLADPAGLAVDGSGNLFIADSSNNRIRKLTRLNFQ